MIKIMSIGNLGGDAVVKNLNGIDYVSFSVAHSIRKETGEEKTTWIDCLMRGGGKLGQYLVKGQMVWLMGDFDARIYDSQKYRCKMISYSCFVDTLRLCGSKPDAGQNVSQAPAQGEPVNIGGQTIDPETGEIIKDDDLPFDEPTPEEKKPKGKASNK